jgi:methyl-accepting chemotaxis protein
MTGLLNNDRYYLNLLLGVLFVLGIGVSLYFIYSLPDSLHLTSGFQPEFISVYIVVGLTFIAGALAVLSAMRYKKEIIVFRDRITDTDKTEGENGDQAGKTTISLESVKSNLQQAEGEKEVLQSALQAISKQLEAGQGAIYRVQEDDGKRFLELKSGYALSIGESTVLRYEFGEGLIGQAAVSGRTLYIDDVPNGYIKIISGLGSASPKYLLIVPVKKLDQVKGVIELASFTPLTEDQRRFAEESAQLIGEKI